MHCVSKQETKAAFETKTTVNKHTLIHQGRTIVQLGDKGLSYLLLPETKHVSIILLVLHGYVYSSL